MTRKILLIEDNPDDIALTQKALEKSGFPHTLTVISDGREALDYLLQQNAYSHLKPKDRPDLIILDLNLPLMSGFEILEHLKADAQVRVIPVIVLTISEGEEDIMRSYELGASSCIRKKIRIEDFDAAINDMMTYWFRFSKLPPKF